MKNRIILAGIATMMGIIGVQGYIIGKKEKKIKDLERANDILRTGLKIQDIYIEALEKNKKINVVDNKKK